MKKVLKIDNFLLSYFANEIACFLKFDEKNTMV